MAEAAARAKSKAKESTQSNSPKVLKNSKIEITGARLTTPDIAAIATFNAKRMYAISPGAVTRMKLSRDYIESEIAAGKTMYGVNTGFGAFSSVRISNEQTEELQRNLVRSHSCGLGKPFSREQTRAILYLRAHTLCRGHSGVRTEVVEKIIQFLNHDILPVVPSQGSVGASGDLAPLAHVALALMGEGRVWNPACSAQAYGEAPHKPAREVLKRLGVDPLVLKAKEGLSLINGCQVMTAVGSISLEKAETLCAYADLASALSIEGLMGSRKAFDPLISRTRPHDGEIRVAANLRALLGETSGISESHRNCDRVQDAYSLRCTPAVHGAARDGLAYAKHKLETEANSSTDNPLVFASERKILSCGNFHGMPVALALDHAALSVATLGSISEQRVAKLVNPAMSGLPAFLTPSGGLHSGYMIPHVVSASLVSENKSLLHPASSDSIPTSADKEDHVSMGTIAARKFARITDNVEKVLAIEFLASLQAIDLVRPLRTSAKLENIYSFVRARIPYAETDRIFGEDIEKMISILQQNEFADLVKRYLE